jgi:CHASE3 domain sensor protein
MEPTTELAQLLREIRDTQREHLAEYRRMAQRSVEMQETAIARQARFATLYRGVVIFVVVVVLGLIGLVVHLMGRLR